MGVLYFLNSKKKVLKIIYVWTAIKIFIMKQVSCSILSWTSENLSVNVFNNVCFYTNGKPVRRARVSPDFMALKLSPLAHRNTLLILLVLFSIWLFLLLMSQDDDLLWLYCLGLDYFFFYFLYLLPHTHLFLK